MNKVKAAANAKARRRQRVRKRIFGTGEKPRLNVFKSNAAVYAQVIDDVQGKTIAAAASYDKELRKSLKSTSKADAAKAVGALVAKRALEAGIETVVFDRGTSPYHGRVKALADGCREAGLRF